MSSSLITESEKQELVQVVDGKDELAVERYVQIIMKSFALNAVKNLAKHHRSLVLDQLNNLPADWSKDYVAVLQKSAEDIFAGIVRIPS